MNKIPAKASDPNDLERHILDPNIAKSEAEWWAKRRIEELEERVKQWEQAGKNWMASPEAGKQLSGYRELADK